MRGGRYDGKGSSQRIIEIIPGITLKGNARQIATFKELLTDNGIGYDKTAIINLAAKRID